MKRCKTVKVAVILPANKRASIDVIGALAVSVQANPAKPENNETIIVGFAGYKCALVSNFELSTFLRQIYTKNVDNSKRESNTFTGRMPAPR
jgi:hypothetical protein